MARVRMLREVAVDFGMVLHPGDVVTVEDDVAESWCKAGLAMRDASMDGGKETKVGTLSVKSSETKRDPNWCSSCGCTHRADSKIGRRHRRKAR